MGYKLNEITLFLEENNAIKEKSKLLETNWINFYHLEYLELFASVSMSLDLLQVFHVALMSPQRTLN